MKNWKQTEIQTLNDYIGSQLFDEADECGTYTYEDESSGLKICIKPTGDYNFELAFNDGETTENALEVVGDAIIFYLYNNNPN